MAEPSSRLLIGGDGEIGAAAFRALKAAGAPVAATTRRQDRAGPDRPLLDLSAPLGDWQPPEGTRSACVLAAVARLADCTADPVRSAHINVTRTLALIERLLEREIHVTFLSTNQVFDGSRPHVAADAPACPVSAYGRQKAATEARLKELMAAGAPLAILRLAKVVSPGMPLIAGWVEALAGGKPIRAFADMTMAPTPIGQVVAAIAALMADRRAGIYQLTGPRDVAYAEVGRFLARRLGADQGLVAEGSAKDAGLPEGANPPHTTLDSRLLAELYGAAVPDAWAVIEGVDARLAAKG
jgi:dTDP-4-dehydrorhamnose reductase